MRAFNYHLHTICMRNCDGAFATKDNRYAILQQAANDLNDLGFGRLKHPQNLKPKHIQALVQNWKDPKKDAKPVGIGTIKNRLSSLRWLAEKIGNPGLLHSKNSYYGVDKRCYVGKDKSVDFTREKLDQITDRRVFYSASLQKHFGLRREEAIKFSVGFADNGDKISLKESWCKGGRGREIPIVNPEQRELLNQIRSEIGNGSLIPNGMKYINQLNVFDRQMKAVGLRNSHGARHAYAQRRYTELTKELLSREAGKTIEGFLPPAKGGLRPRAMSAADRAIDKAARSILTQELGHNRIQIVANYLG